MKSLQQRWKEARRVKAMEDLSHLMSHHDEVGGIKVVMTEFGDSLRVVKITFMPGTRSLSLLPKMDQLLALSKVAFPKIPLSELRIDVGQPERRCGDMVNTIYISEFHGFKYHVHAQYYPVLER